MSTKGNQVSTEAFLRSVALPEKTKTYTPITHGDIIDKLAAELSNANFIVEGADYIHSFDGEVAIGKVYIQSTKDPDMGMLFSWANSYNKKVKFSCGVGAFVYENKTSFFGTEGLSWIRKHTGTANAEAFTIIEQIVDHAHYHFDKIIAEKNRMKAQPIDIISYGRVMGALFFEHELLKPTQVNAIDREYKDEKSEVTDKDNLWGLYKILMFGIDNTDIIKWQQSQQKLHHMIMAEYALSQEMYDELDTPVDVGTEEKLHEYLEEQDKGGPLESHRTIIFNVPENTTPITKEECCIEGSHMASVDDEGNCNNCGEQEPCDVPVVEIEDDGVNQAEYEVNVEDDRAEWAEKELANPQNEDVGPPEMYIAGIDTANGDSESSVTVAKIHEDGLIEVVDDVTSDVTISDDEASFLNLAVQLGYEKHVAEMYLVSLYDSDLAVSLNTKAFRIWADAGGGVEIKAVEEEIDAEVVEEQEIRLPDTSQEQLVAEYNAIHDDSHMNVEYLPIEEVVEKYDDNMTVEQLAAILKVPAEMQGEEPTKEVGSKVLEIKRAQAPVLEQDAFKTPLDGFTSMAINAGYGADLVAFYASDHFDINLEVTDNYDAFVKWAPAPSKPASIEPIQPTVDLSEIEGAHTIEEMPAVIAKVEEKIEEAKAETIIEPALDIKAETENHQASLDVLFSAEVKVEEEESTIEPVVIPEEPVAIIAPKPVEEPEVDPFDLGEDFLDITEQEGLEISQETLDQAKVIEEKMAILYGSVKPYQVINTPTQISVTIDETEECFFIPVD